MKKKTFVSPTCKVVEMQTENLMTGSTGPTNPNASIQSGGSNKQPGAPTKAESRKAMHITDNGYDY